jgi:hypothetical protein
MELRRAAEDAQEVGLVGRDWCVGSETFRKGLLAQMSAGPEHYGPEMRKSFRLDNLCPPSHAILVGGMRRRLRYPAYLACSTTVTAAHRPYKTPCPEEEHSCQ